MHLNIDQNVNEKAPEIAFPFPLTGELRVTSAVEANATIGNEKVKLEAGKQSPAVNVKGVSTITVNPSTPGMVNVAFTDAIADPKESRAKAVPVDPAPETQPSRRTSSSEANK